MIATAISIIPNTPASGPFPFSDLLYSRINIAIENRTVIVVISYLKYSCNSHVLDTSYSKDISYSAMILRRDHDILFENKLNTGPDCIGSFSSYPSVSKFFECSVCGKTKREEE